MTTDQPTPPTSDAIDAGSGVRFALNDVLDAFDADFEARDGEPMTDTERETIASAHVHRARVHAALAASLPDDVMLAELVKRGTLTEKWRWVEPFEPSDPKRRHRLVTPWEVAP